MVAILVHSLAVKSKKRLAHDVFDTFATQFGLAYEVTDKTAGHKMAVLTVVFPRLLNGGLFTQEDQK